MSITWRTGSTFGECFLTTRKARKLPVHNKAILATYIMHDQGQPVNTEKKKKKKKKKKKYQQKKNKKKKKTDVEKYLGAFC